MSYKYILGTKDKNWFFMFHTVDCTLVTHNIEQAVGVNYYEDVPKDWIDRTIENSIKFVDHDGSEMDLPFEKIIGIDIKKEDLCVFEVETKIEYTFKIL